MTQLARLGGPPNVRQVAGELAPALVAMLARNQP